MPERRIFKFPAESGGGYVINYPNAKPVLVAQNYPGDLYPTLWCEVVDEERDTGQTVFHCVGTGFSLIPGEEHVGSAVCGEMVWHVHHSRHYKPLPK